MIEILVRALGLNPVIPEDVEDIKVGKLFNNRWVSRAVMIVLVIFLVLLYGLLVVMELYSKRSSLCVRCLHSLQFGSRLLLHLRHLKLSL